MSRRFVRKVAHSVGVAGLFRAVNRRGLRILMYHRFGPETQGLARQCEHLARRYRPVSLQQIADSFVAGTPLPPNAVAITVDDGYRDFLEHGHPVFRAHDIPTTMFVVSDFLDGKLWLWVDIVKYLLAETALTTATVTVPGGPPQTFTFASPEGRRAAAREISALLKQMDNVERLRALDALARSLAVQLPAAPPRTAAPLTWDEVRELVRHGVEFGAHTKTHPILSHVTDPAVLEEEIVVPKTRIESETGRRVRHFCYPNGRRQDFTAQTIEALTRAGFQTAVTTERGLNFPGAPPLMLRRLGVEPDSPMPYFEELLAGIRAD